MNRLCVAVIVLASTLESIPAFAQVKPQVAPLVTNGCEAYDEFTPGQLQKTNDPRLTTAAPAEIQACIQALDVAIEKLAETGATQPGLRTDATSKPSTSAAADATAAAAAAGPSVNENRKQASANGAAAADEVLGSTKATSDTADEQVHIALVKAYLAFRNLQRWKELVDDGRYVQNRPDTSRRRSEAERSNAGATQTRDLPTAPTATDQANRRDVVAAFNKLAERLHSTLTQHGLTQPFAATLVTAFALTGAGSASTAAAAGTPAASGAATSTSDSTSTAQPAGFVNWESIHFYAAPDRPWDVSLAGSFGFQPVLALVQPAAGQSSGSTSIDTTYQQAFVWSVAVEPNRRIADLAEVTPFARIGQSILSSTATLNDKVTPAVVEVAAPNGTGRAELFAEAGMRLSIYGQSLEILHLKRGLLTPMFSFATGLRRDNRFTKGGVLSAVNAPEQRVFFRFQVDGLQLADKGQADKPFTVGISVDFDGALRRGSNAVPSGTRVLLRGDLNLFKAGQSQK